MPTIFISYRREDAAGHAGRLADRLIARFGDDHVFMDVEDIEPGDKFAQSIDQTVARCDCLVAIVGPRWLEALQRRAASGEDFVRREIAAALARDVRVIPVLVAGATLPQASHLPSDLAPLSQRHAVEVRDERFDDDASRLVEAIAGIVPVGHVQGLRWLRSWPIIAGLVALVAGALVWSLAGDDGGRSAGPQPTTGVDAGAPSQTIPSPQASPEIPEARPGRSPASEPVSSTPARPAVVAAPAPVDLSGEWIAEMQDEGRPMFRARLRLIQRGDRVRGEVQYPTGTGVIQEGELRGTILRLTTRHTPQFESEPATITIEGDIVGDRLELLMISDQSTTPGVARRANQP